MINKQVPLPGIWQCEDDVSAHLPAQDVPWLDSCQRHLLPRFGETNVHSQHSSSHIAPGVRSITQKQLCTAQGNRATVHATGRRQLEAGRDAFCTTQHSNYCKQHCLCLKLLIWDIVKAGIVTKLLKPQIASYGNMNPLLTEQGQHTWPISARCYSWRQALIISHLHTLFSSMLPIG